MIVASPVQFQGLGDAKSAVARIQQLLKMLPNPGGDRYNPHRTDGVLDARTAWALMWAVKNGVAQIPVLGFAMTPFTWLVNQVEGKLGSSVTFNIWRVLYDVGGSGIADAGVPVPSAIKGLKPLKNSIVPAVTGAAVAIENALNQAIGNTGGSGTGVVPIQLIKKTFYPEGTFAIRDPGQNQYRILRAIK